MGRATAGCTWGAEAHAVMEIKRGRDERTAGGGFMGAILMTCL